MIKTMEKENINNKDIAIIGISFQIPNANNLGEFWDNLKKGRVCTGTFSEQRKKDIYDYLNFVNKELKNERGWQGGIDDFDTFDYRFFNFSPTEAELTDPHQRKFLELAWSAIEDGGYMGKKIKGSNTGIFLGFADYYYSYGRMANDVYPDKVTFGSPSNLDSVITGRLSHLLDLK